MLYFFMLKNNHDFLKPRQKKHFYEIFQRSLSEKNREFLAKGFGWMKHSFRKLIKECLMVSVRISSSGCTREVAKHEKSVRVARREAE